MIVDSDNLRNVREQHENETIALRFGSFDLWHPGHQEAVEFASEQADRLVVGVMNDAIVKRRKGPGRPVTPQEDRLDIIDSLEEVDYSFITPESTFGIVSLFRNLNPDVFVERPDGKESLLKKIFLGTQGIELVIDPGEKIDSTTSMIARMGLAQAITQSKLNHLA